MRGRVLALLLSVPLVASGAAGVVLHVCQSMGGMVVGDCDCDKQADHGANTEHQGQAKHAASAKLQTPPCCSDEISNAGDLLATQEAFAERVDQASIALLEWTSADGVASRRDCEPGLLRERAPPNIHGPPIFVRHCSFLN